MLRNVLFVRKFVEKAHESSFPLGNEIQVAQPVRGGPRGTKWGLHNLYFDWASSSRATDNVGYIAVWGETVRTTEFPEWKIPVFSAPMD